MTKIRRAARGPLLLFMALALQLLWGAGLRTHLVCFEADGTRHAEMFAATCATDCDAGTSGDVEPVAPTAPHPAFAAPVPCDDCTDLTIQHAGYPRLAVPPVDTAPSASATPLAPPRVARVSREMPDAAHLAPTASHPTPLRR